MFALATVLVLSALVAAQTCETPLAVTDFVSTRGPRNMTVFSFAISGPGPLNAPPTDALCSGVAGTLDASTASGTCGDGTWTLSAGVLAVTQQRTCNRGCARNVTVCNFD